MSLHNILPLFTFAYCFCYLAQRNRGWLHLFTLHYNTNVLSAASLQGHVTDVFTQIHYKRHVTDPANRFSHILYICKQVPDERWECFKTTLSCCVVLTVNYRHVWIIGCCTMYFVVLNVNYRLVGCCTMYFVVLNVNNRCVGCCKMYFVVLTVNYRRVGCCTMYFVVLTVNYRRVTYKPLF